MTTHETIDAPTDFERARVVRSDLQLLPVSSEEEDYVSAPADYKITTFPADFTLEVIHQKWREEEFQIPEFQRDFVWKQMQSSKLIESFLVGLPVPPVFVYRDMESERYFVIDGQQRLKSIVYYFEGYFGEEAQHSRKVFYLTGLSPDSRFAGSRFTDLREEDQRRLKNAVLRSFVVQQLEPDDSTSMYHVFERLNTGGTLLTNQEIRDCVYDGSFAKILKQLNRNPSWRKILGKPKPDSRKRDIELMVRFFAMQNHSSYQKPMKDFLSKFMNKNRNASPDSLDSTAKIFTETCGVILNTLGPKPFHVRNGLNVAVTDAVMVAFSQHLHRIPSDIKERYEALKNDEKFTDTTTQATTDVDTVHERFTRAEKMLFGRVKR